MQAGSFAGPGLLLFAITERLNYTGTAVETVSLSHSQILPALVFSARDHDPWHPDCRHPLHHRRKSAQLDVSGNRDAFLPPAILQIAPPRKAIWLQNIGNRIYYSSQFPVYFDFINILK